MTQMNVGRVATRQACQAPALYRRVAPALRSCDIRRVDNGAALSTILALHPTEGIACT